jgi:hypothetical protein
MNDLKEYLAARQFFANRLEAHFRAHPLIWVSLPELMQIGGPSWRSRIANDLRQKRQLNVVWNKSNLQSAYMFLPYVPLGRSADVPTGAQLEMFR